MLTEVGNWALLDLLQLLSVRIHVYQYSCDIAEVSLASAILGPVVQSTVSLTNLLMTNSLTVVAMVFSNTLIFLLKQEGHDGPVMLT